VSHYLRYLAVNNYGFLSVMLINVKPERKRPLEIPRCKGVVLNWILNSFGGYALIQQAQNRENEHGNER